MDTNTPTARRQRWTTVAAAVGLLAVLAGGAADPMSGAGTALPPGIEAV